MLMSGISTLFFVYGIDNFWEEEFRKIEFEFAEELKWLDELKEKPVLIAKTTSSKSKFILLTFRHTEGYICIWF